MSVAIRRAIVRVLRLLERLSTPLLLGWLLLIGYLLATGVTSMRVAFGAPEPSRRRNIVVRAQAPTRRSADAIIEHNPFDSIGDGQGPVPLPPATLIDVDPLSAPECDSTQVVIVTEDRDPTRSVAALQTALELRPHDHRVGDHDAGKTVEFIGYNPKQNAPSVWLSNASGLCQSSLFVSRVKLPSKAATAPDFAAGGAPRGALFSHLRVVPEAKGGAVIGVRLFGIRSDSVLRIIGLENGDRLESINGFALGTPEQALRAYAQLRTASRLALSLNRRGSPLILTYRID